MFCCNLSGNDATLDHHLRAIVTLILPHLRSSTSSPKRGLREVVQNLKIMSLQEP